LEKFIENRILEVGGSLKRRLRLTLPFSSRIYNGISYCLLIWALYIHSPEKVVISAEVENEISDDIEVRVHLCGILWKKHLF
jgi:hypothetical protein